MIRGRSERAEKGRTPGLLHEISRARAFYLVFGDVFILMVLNDCEVCALRSRDCDDHPEISVSEVWCSVIS
jgi:hypothetical protein